MPFKFIGTKNKVKPFVTNILFFCKRLNISSSIELREKIIEILTSNQIDKEDSYNFLLAAALIDSALRTAYVVEPEFFEEVQPKLFESETLKDFVLDLLLIPEEQKVIQERLEKSILTVLKKLEHLETQQYLLILNLFLFGIFVVSWKALQCIHNLLA